MQHNRAGRKLRRSTPHRLAMFSNQLASLVTHERIETTLTKAKELRPLAERLVTRMVKGFPRGSWEKEPGRRNEALDCRVYARAAAAIYGLDRFEERHWRRMEEALARTVERDDELHAPLRAPVRTSARQVIHSGYMAR